MDVKGFEDRRWTRGDQSLEFRHRAALALVGEVGAKTVLDLGAGDGLFLAMLQKKGVVGKGLDISEEGVRKMKSKGLDAEVFDFSKITLPSADGAYDVVVALDVLEHLYDPGTLLKEASRAAEKSVIVGVPNFSSLPARIQTLFGRVPENNRPKKGHVYWFNFTVLRDIGEKAGLSVRALKVNTTFERVPVIGSIFRALAPVWPSLFALSFVVCFDKK